MAVLVTRPLPDGETTAAELRARGFEVVAAPMLRFEPFGFSEGDQVPYGGIIVTSANAVRAVEPSLARSPLLKLPLFSVGERTAAAARAAGFAKVLSADGDAAALRDLVVESAKAKKLKKKSPLLYLAGEELARDLAGDLREMGFEVITHIAYRMVPAKSLPDEVIDGFAAGRIEAVLHYSRRSARAFVEAARTGGVEISALALPQCCISPAVAEIVREAGATQVTVAARPDENALFEALKRALPARLA
ncbi:uroporphyrinogen-III synthase [Bradyrhizobium sp.]|uniref:uroporphyrinogen-III synthase n=1 Tax=Bradyrhizobium sp. TaxID=376 RepID=UPI001D756422|nr:uroporphyrinogen-III synthase [Bradyrhizobium sp.]MBI5322623.1 uroporphyrinogen-III synthase [Bradyrhizobium sp.]